MENLILFTAILAITLGVVQLFFPQILKNIEEFTDQMFNFDEFTPMSFRKVSGIILVTVAGVLFYLVYKHDF